MRVLLDTHALLWAIGEPARLSSAARKLIVDRSNDLAVSAASAWEIATKVRIGKLPGAERIVDDYAGQLRRLGAEELAISGAHALLAGSLRWAHRDPFDRVLAAQAITEGMPFLTADPAFTDLAALTVRW